MSRAWLTLSCCVATVLSFANLAIGSVNLPTDDEVNGILKLCAMGRVQSVEADVRGKIDLWKRVSEAKGKTSLEDLGAMLQNMTSASSSVEIYKTYTDCVKDSISKFLNSSLPKLNDKQVLEIIDVNRNRQFIEQKIGPPIYAKSWPGEPSGNLVEAGYARDKITLQVFYLNTVSVQYIVTVNDASFSPDVAEARKSDVCFGCASMAKYSEAACESPLTINDIGTLKFAFQYQYKDSGKCVIESDINSKGLYYVELCNGATSASGGKSLYIGYTSFGGRLPDVEEDAGVDFFKLSKATRELCRKTKFAKSDLNVVNVARNKLTPNTFTVRSWEMPAAMGEKVDLSINWRSILSLPITEDH